MPGGGTQAVSHADTAADSIIAKLDCGIWIGNQTQSVKQIIVIEGCIVFRVKHEAAVASLVISIFPNVVEWVNLKSKISGIVINELGDVLVAIFNGATIPIRIVGIFGTHIGINIWSDAVFIVLYNRSQVSRCVIFVFCHNVVRICAGDQLA